MLGGLRSGMTPRLFSAWITVLAFLCPIAMCPPRRLGSLGVPIVKLYGGLASSLSTRWMR